MNYARDFGVDVTTWTGFWWMVTGSMFGRELVGVPLVKLPYELLQYSFRLWSNFLGLGFILGLIGLRAGFKRRPQVHFALALMFSGHLLFVLTYSVADKELMLLPTFVIWGLWVALGARAAVRYMRGATGDTIAISGAALLLVMAAANVALNFSRVDISDDWSARERGEMLLRWLPADTLYLGTWADAAIIDYLQLVEGWRPDVKLSNTFLVRGVRRQALVEEQLSRSGEVYASAPVGLRPNYRFELDETCDCYRVERRLEPWCARVQPTLQSRPAQWPLQSPHPLQSLKSTE